MATCFIDFILFVFTPQVLRKHEPTDFAKKIVRAINCGRKCCPSGPNGLSNKQAQPQQKPGLDKRVVQVISCRQKCCPRSPNGLPNTAAQPQRKSGSSTWPKLSSCNQQAASWKLQIASYEPQRCKLDVHLFLLISIHCIWLRKQIYF